MDQSDWGSAAWIGGGNLLRKEFETSFLPTRVSIFVAACQYYKLSIDGVPIGDHELDVVWTRFKYNRSYVETFS